MARILGIDPGSRLCGYGCIDVIGNQLQHVAQGTLRLVGREQTPFEQRLLLLYEGLNAVIQKFKPKIMVVEKVFFAKNVVSALKLGQARGVVLLCGAANSLEVYEYSPTEVKQAITGYGRASKEQISKMVQLLIGKREFETADASDALALSICHAHSSTNAYLKRALENKRQLSECPAYEAQDQ